MPDAISSPGFHALGLRAPVASAAENQGYQTPSPIQSRCIPLLLEGHDLIGQAQTGTGKTAAFALPILSSLDWHSRQTQWLVLTPTRELAQQVAASISAYASGIPGFQVLSVYGGRDYASQLRALKQGVHVVVGTPGRIMDHMRRKSLRLDALTHLVLDEGDEMLRMGFIDDVEWILGQLPESRQTALFSATLPAAIERVAEKYMRQPQRVKVMDRAVAADTVHQRYCTVRGIGKPDALLRILENETPDATLIFVRTKAATLELAERLVLAGFSAAPLNGDIPQRQREQTVSKIRDGELDILVATDVAARGLDIERVSHVINYDVPNDVETYVHRIGRTGRAGRSGEAISLFLPNQMRLLRVIEKGTRQAVQPLPLPSAEEISQQRIRRFKDTITRNLAREELADYQSLIRDFQAESGADPLSIAAALALMARGADHTPINPDNPRTRRATTPLAAPDDAREPSRGKKARRNQTNPTSRQAPRVEDATSRKPSRGKKARRNQTNPTSRQAPRVEQEAFIVQVGHKHGVTPRNLVGAIANEAELDSHYIGAIEISDTHSRVELPVGMPREIMRILKNARVCGRKLDIARPASADGSVTTLAAVLNDPPHKRGPKKPAKPLKLDTKGGKKQAFTPAGRERKKLYPRREGMDA